jgi:ABC-type phosphonate transport system ATPase subunit
MAERVDIYLQRNEDWGRSLFVTDIDDNPIDLTGMTVGMQVRDKLTQALVETATATIVDAPGGEVSVILRASPGSALSAFGEPIQVANLHYDCRITDSDGFDTILFGGVVVLSRGETV